MIDINNFENKILKRNFNNETLIEYKAKKEKQGKWHLVRTFIIAIFIAILLISIAYLIYKKSKNENLNLIFVSNAFLSVGGGVIAGSVFYILNNIRQANIFKIKQQSPQIKQIKNLFSYIFSLIIFLEDKSSMLLFFRFEAHILPQNITKEIAISEFKNCISEMEKIKLEDCTILKEYEPNIYFELSELIKHKYSKEFDKITNEELLKRITEIDTVFFNVDRLLQNDLAGISFYAKNIQTEIL